MPFARFAAGVDEWNVLLVDARVARSAEGTITRGTPKSRIVCQFDDLQRVQGRATATRLGPRQAAAQQLEPLAEIVAAPRPCPKAFELQDYIEEWAEAEAGWDSVSVLR